MNDLLVNMLASMVAATVGWLAQRLLRYRRLVRKRAFFGLDKGSECLLSVPRHMGSTSHLSVHRRDVAALVELATIGKDCDAQVELMSDQEMPKGLGRVTEFCVGGPTSNPRTAAHLRSMLPGVEFLPFALDEAGLPFTVGTARFQRVRGATEYVLLARTWGPAGGRPVFIIAGQTARTNFAAARFLANGYRTLESRYGAGKRFCLVLQVVESRHYGPDFAEIFSDVTADALEPPTATNPATEPSPARTAAPTHAAAPEPATKLEPEPARDPLPAPRQADRSERGERVDRSEEPEPDGWVAGSAA